MVSVVRRKTPALFMVPVLSIPVLEFFAFSVGSFGLCGVMVMKSRPHGPPPRARGIGPARAAAGRVAGVDTWILDQVLYLSAKNTVPCLTPSLRADN